MQKDAIIWKKETGRRLPVGLCSFLCSLHVAICLGLAGCQGSRNQTSDPLMGAHPSQSAQPPAPLASAPPKPTAAPAVPPPPVPSSLTSNAALASTSSRSLDSSNDLRIGNSSPAAGNSGGWQGRGTPVAMATSQPASGIDPAARHDSLVARGVSPASGARVASYEQAQAILAARGVKWQRLETWGEAGEWKFSCSIPSRQNAFISRTYEGRATDYLSAVRAVLNQIDQDH